MGELIALAVALIIYLVFAKYINYLVKIVTMVLPSEILVFITFAIAVSIVLFVIGRKKDGD